MSLSSMAQQVIAEEAQVVEAGYTLGAFNRGFHTSVVANARLNTLTSMESGHLKFVRGKGVVKTQEATCSLCVIDGLDDGRWHDPRTMTIPKSENA